MESEKQREMSNKASESFPMNAGDGPNSYTLNSSYQRGGLNIVKEMIDEAISEKLDIHVLSTSELFSIADLGCSTGPNTFTVVQNIIDAVKLKFQSHCIEFQVFFNDHVSNDFNTLFKLLPSSRTYFAGGQPGSFHGRLFPKASLHFVHSSYALHWLSVVPNEVVNESSPAYNKGRIHYGNAAKEVIDAYSAQFAKDFEAFLQARAQELVPGGLMALLLPGIPDDTPPSQSPFVRLFELMGLSLADMTRMRLVSEAQLDSFNLPVYNASLEELKALIGKNGRFSIERMEPVFRYAPTAETCTIHLRAGGMERVFSEYFGSEIMDEFFDRFAKKVAESSILADLTEQNSAELFVLLQRKSSTS
ncbi:hypothetical protein Syun_021829 [Stephania yunnanensis]|uniref:S-adenosylmethionine-dependent methyltransferase n=1 Tax=Stephania yunnanensis TaxID=152371 RepID=A0AAP0IGQ3_9MAGN